MTPFDQNRAAEADVTASLDKLIEARLIDPTSNALAQFKASELQNDVNLEATPWFIQLFFGLSGVLISVFVLVIVALMLIAQSVDLTPALFITVAVILSGLGYVMLAHVSRAAPFLSGLALSLAIGAQGYWLMGLIAYPYFDKGYGSLSAQLVALILVELVLTLLMPSFFYRLISSAIMLASLLYWLQLLGLSSLGLAVLATVFISTTMFAYRLSNWFPKRFLMTGWSVLQALMWSSALLLMTMAIFFIQISQFFANFGAEGADYTLDTYRPILSQGLLALVAAASALLLFRRYDRPLLSLPSLLIVIAIIAVGAISIWASGLLAIALVMIVAFANGERLLQAVATLLLACYAFWYYYQLDTSLLIKSAMLLALALVCLLLRALMVIPRFKGGKL